MAGTQIQAEQKTSGEEPRPPEPSRLLAIYVRDHLAGAAGGVALADRCLRNNTGTQYEHLLAQIAGDIRDDHNSLRSIMDRLDIQPSRLKSALGAIAELFGRVKGNGRMARYSPSSRVVELEGLAAGVATKRNLWRSLRCADLGPAVPADELDRLADRATEQFERLLAAHEQAAEEAFGTERR